MSDKDAGESKPALRRRYLAARGARSASDLEAARTAIRAVVLGECAAGGWRCVAAYEPLRTEPGSTGLLQQLVSDGVRVIVPVTLPDRDLDWVEWVPGASGVRLGHHGIAAADAVLVPALAVARDGTRLGRGGGSYDRALPRARSATPRLALLFDGELVDALPGDAWDERVTGVILPTGVRALD